MRAAKVGVLHATFFEVAVGVNARRRPTHDAGRTHESRCVFPIFYKNYDAERSQEQVAVGVNGP